LLALVQCTNHWNHNPSKSGAELADLLKIKFKIKFVAVTIFVLAVLEALLVKVKLWVVTVGKRPFVVSEIAASTVPCSIERSLVSHLLKLSSVEDDGLGEELQQVIGNLSRAQRSKNRPHCPNQPVSPA
jgi:hypothetical protein